MTDLVCGRGCNGHAVSGVDAYVLAHLEREGVDGVERCAVYFRAKAAHCDPRRDRALDAAAADPGLAARYWHAFATIAGCHWGSAQTIVAMMAAFPELRGPHLEVERRLRVLYGLGEVGAGMYVQVLASVLGALAPPARRLALDRWSALAAAGEHNLLRVLVGLFLHGPARPGCPRWPGEDALG